jgi:hypothetical protein
VIRRILGLGALVALLGPVSCLKDEDPGPFGTAGTCVHGDIEGCLCNKQGDPGVSECGADGHFGTCRCLGCSLSPDCAKCNDCLSGCLCQTFGSKAQCTTYCASDAGSRPAQPPPR